MLQKDYEGRRPRWGLSNRRHFRFFFFFLVSTVYLKIVYSFNIITHALVHRVRALVHGLLYFRMYKRVQHVAKDDVDRSTTA